MDGNEWIVVGRLYVTDGTRVVKDLLKDGDVLIKNQRKTVSAELRNVHKKYKVTNGKLTRSNPFCLRCGKGVFMRDAGDFWACGKCGDRIRKEIEEEKT